MVDGEVTITRADRLRIPRDLTEPGRIAAMKAFKTRITDWGSPKVQVFDEPIIVCIKRSGLERCVDHFHVDVMRFEELIDQKRIQGYDVSAKDGVIAYLLVFTNGTRHLIAGFLSTFPEFSTVTPGTVGQILSRLRGDGWFK